MAMAEEIENRFPSKNADAPSWLSCLSENRREEVRKKAQRAKDSDGFLSYIYYSEFCDKATILTAANIFPGSRTALKRDFKNIRDLRDKIAHASLYAASFQEASKFCKTVDLIVRLTERLIDMSHGKRV